MLSKDEPMLFVDFMNVSFAHGQTIIYAATVINMKIITVIHMLSSALLSEKNLFKRIFITGLFGGISTIHSP